MTGTRAPARMARLASLVSLLVLAAGCSGSEDPAGTGPTTAPSERPAPKALRLPTFHHEGSGPMSRLNGCASLYGEEDAGYTRPLLIWVRLRVTEHLRLLPATYAERSNAIDSVTQYLGPDPGPRAPHLAVSIGDAGEGPTADREEYDSHLIGDIRHGPARLRAARKSWDARVPLEHGVPIGPGDHYLFVEVDPAKGGMDLHVLTARWTRDGKHGHRLIGDLSARVQCGG